MKIKQVLLTLSFVCGITFLANSQTTTNPSQKTNKPTNATTLLVGKWKGTYDGGTPGKCEMEFTKNGNGTLTGQIAIQPEGSEKSSPAAFNSVTLEGNNLKASFNDPDGTPIQVEGKLENNQLKGKWSTSGDEGGSWQTTKSQ